jgi:hypothetical protein
MRGMMAVFSQMVLGFGDGGSGTAVVPVGAIMFESSIKQ